jgi:NAD(P)-dependent dehydrogenase (short-subunit alcohol dehydrogenase family)
MRDAVPALERVFSLKGKAALITGAGGGIGSVFAAALAEAGAVVGIHDITGDKLEETRRQIEGADGRVVPLVADLSRVEECRRLIRDAHESMGRLDVLVNCAGINRRKPIEAVTEDDYEAIMAVNLRSVYFLSQAAIPIMRAQGCGKIVNIGSSTISFGLATTSVYGATKAGVAALTRTMAVEWAKDNVQVNCIAPGYFLTPLTDGSVWADGHKSRWLLDRIPARRPGLPKDLVGVLLLLASDASAYITGETVAVDGGFQAGGSWETDV